MFVTCQKLHDHAKQSATNDESSSDKEEESIDDKTNVTYQEILLRQYRSCKGKSHLYTTNKY